MRPARQKERLLSATYLGGWVVVALWFCCQAGAAPAPEGVLAAGTPYETPYYRLAGEPPEPVALVLGGVHGDEVAGYLAARVLLQGHVRRGTLIVVPEVNRPAIRRSVRHVESVSRFYGDWLGTPPQRLVAELWALIQQVNPDFGITLHESRDYHWHNPAHYGQTFTHDVHTFDDVIGHAMARVNRRIPEPKQRFSIFAKPVPGCFTWVISTQLQRPATTVETCRRLPLATRLRYQLLAAKALLDESGILYENGRIPPLDAPAPAPRAPAPAWHEMIVNGDFSNRLDGWEADAASMPDVMTLFRGCPSIRARATGAGPSEALSQEARLEDAARFRAEVWTRVQGAGAPSLRLTFRDSVGNAVGEAVTASTTPVTDASETQWYLIRATGAVPPLAERVTFSLISGPALSTESAGYTWFAAARLAVQARPASAL